MESTAKELEQSLDAIRRALATLRYGSIEIIVHDSKVVQIERKEKIRLPQEDTRNKEHP